MHALRLLRRCGPAGANGPNRFVGDNRAGEGLDLVKREYSLQLAPDDVLGRAGVALG